MVATCQQITCIFLLFSVLCDISLAFRALRQITSVPNAARISKIPPRFSEKTTIRCGTALNEYVATYEELQIPTLLGIHMVDITPDIRRIVAASGIQSGVVTILSKHTTTAITINEMEGRLVDDTRQFLLKLVPAAYPYLHNDLHLRDGPPGWPGGNEAWRAQEPINAHSHLISMLLGASKSVPVHGGEVKIGTWQSIIMVELDGPRTRSVAVQVTGVK